MANGPCNEQGPEWAPSAHARGLFAAANVSCGGGMLMFQAGRHVAMPQRQWRPYARAAARVTEPQEQCRLETAASHAASIIPKSQSQVRVRLAMGENSQANQQTKTSGFALD